MVEWEEERNEELYILQTVSSSIQYKSFFLPQPTLNNIIL